MVTQPRGDLSAFGLTVASEFDIPELPAATNPDDPDVRITEGTVNRPTDAEADQITYRTGPDELLLLFGAATISLREGREMIVDPTPAVHDEIIRHLIIGPAFNYLLHQRGYFVLHASTVAVGDVSVAFVGESGMGKTTAATAFLCAGHEVLSDDVAAIELDDGRPRVRSGYPSIKLEPAIVDLLDVPVEEPRRTSQRRDRHFHALEDGQPETPVPLERIYLLEDAEHTSVRPLESESPVLELVRNTYTISLLGDEAESNFLQCASLAESVPVRRLRRQRNLDQLPELVEVVEEDLDAETA